MTLEDYKELELGETTNTLRQSRVAENLTIFQTMSKNIIREQILNLLKYEGDIEACEEFRIAYTILRDICVLKGKGTDEEPYTISTEFGSGGFVDLRYFMKDKKFPSYIKNNRCHSNCYDFARRQQCDCQVITGIYQMTKASHLHTVIGLGGAILDFNWGIAMKEELYFQLFNFEVLNRVDSSKIKENHELLFKNLNVLNNDITYAELNACYDEILEYVKTNAKTDNV